MREKVDLYKNSWYCHTQDYFNENKLKHRGYMSYGKSGESRLRNRHVQRPISNGLKKNENMYEWLKEQKWSDFAKSLSEYYVTYSGFTENQLKSAIKMRKKVDKFYDPSGASVENGVYMDGLNKEIYKLSWVVEGDFKSRSLRKRRIDSPTWFEVKNGYSRTARDDFFTNVANGNLIKLTEEGIIKIGKNTGICCVCGKVLDDPQSIAAGIGPTCAKRTTS